MIHFVVGTKAQLIKTAPLMRVLRQRGIPYRYISTGQHRDTMSDILDNFGLSPPDHRLYDGPDITSIGRMLVWALQILWRTLVSRKELFGSQRKDSVVLVHGDTFSTLLGALMGRFAGLKVGHLESGLRSFDLWNPFPEELTRLLVFRLSHFYYCPGPESVAHLSEYSGECIDTGGNTLYDSVHHALEHPQALPVELLRDLVRFTDQGDREFGIVTLHRFENFRDRDSSELMVRLVEGICQRHPLLFILHKPTELALRRFGLLDRLKGQANLMLHPRLDYVRFLQLIRRAGFLVSDGGSNQEECHYMGKPVLLLRHATERPEGIGTNAVLSKMDPQRIEDFLANLERYRYPSVQLERSPSERIADHLENRFENGSR